MAIHTYAKKCDTDGVREELAKGASVNALDEKDFTPLAYVAANPSASIEMLSLLFEAGADVNAAVEKGKTYPLSLAACSGNLEAIEFLMNAGALVNAESPKGYTALINSMYRLYDSKSLLPVIDLLVDRGADIDCETDYGEMPVTVASRLGRFDAVRALVDAGANPLPLKWTSLATAVAIGTNDEVVRALSSDGLNSERDRFGRPPGILAATAGSIKKGRLLAEKGWDINERGKSQETALMCCASANHSKMLAWLIAENADLDAIDDSTNTALILAAQAGSAECVQLMLKAGANPRLVNECNETAMSNASSIEVVRQLQNTGEDLRVISTEMKRTFTGLSEYSRIDVTTEQYGNDKRPRFGKINPQEFDVPFWRTMVRTGRSAYEARMKFGDADDMSAPVWCFARFGSSFSELPDGRFIQVGGEHEDHYDPDFCIYNDVIVHSGPGDFRIYGYPKEVFQPTDFHTATYSDRYIYIVGCLGYHGTRAFGTTPVYRLSCTSWNMESVQTSGEKPGWIYEHSARLDEPGTLIVSGGKVVFENNDEETHNELQGEYSLTLSTMTWKKSK